MYVCKPLPPAPLVHHLLCQASDLVVHVGELHTHGAKLVRGGGQCLRVRCFQRADQ